MQFNNTISNKPPKVVKDRSTFVLRHFPPARKKLSDQLKVASKKKCHYKFVAGVVGLVPI
jgi:hypothetical protein